MNLKVMIVYALVALISTSVILVAASLYSKLDTKATINTDPRAFIITGQMASYHSDNYKESHDELGGLIETVDLKGSLGAVKIIPEEKLTDANRK